ncbi:SprT family zinc-dependent metalloprotease [Volucribacter amazonae]|uniref:Protein SprT n=1 Tax=Volucribacter amazonae TaxID=256731 RepID=A0A9X4PDN3_9PAST|nr:SprT family zinc-dependent metalloprotease [Volucribacter amazonae]MDG6895636.1 SprT family protein [Volucribacter amazonae]
MQQQQLFRHINLQVIRQVKHCLQQAEQYFQRHFAFPQIEYKLRGLKAGVAYLQQNKINLNRTLLLENQQAFIHQTVPHEIAHLIVYQQFGLVKPHGAQWQFVMQEIFHCPATTCHQFDVSNVQGKTFLYQCACQQYPLSLRRHNNIQRNGAVYYCRKCKGALDFVG